MLGLVLIEPPHIFGGKYEVVDFICIDVHICERVLINFKWIILDYQDQRKPPPLKALQEWSCALGFGEGIRGVKSQRLG